MSLILEALRKSEAERRRGSTPDVAMELPPTALPRARGNPGWLLPATLLAMLTLAAAWWWLQRNANPPPPRQELATAPVAEPPIALPPPPAVVPRPMPSPEASSARPAAATSQAPANVPEAIAMPTPSPMPIPVPQPMPAPAPADNSGVADIGATSLPPVKLSMHIWDASPGKRFVILDGQRMGEGDRNGEVTVVAIERDGVVVERKGQRARVPLP